MASSKSIKIFLITLGSVCTGLPCSYSLGQPAQPLLVPGIVLGLRHNMNQELISPNNHMICFSAPAGTRVNRMNGGDLGAPLHRGYEWWMLRDDPTANPGSYRLPPGIVLGLKHSKNQANVAITVFGRDPLTGPKTFSGFKKQTGGDLGAPSGHGYYWYESTGEGFSDWRIVDRLPRWVVLGLKHSKNQRNKIFSWMGKKYDPTNPRITPPKGFHRVVGGDRNGSRGEGYYWYEKVTGPEVIIRPNLTARLSRTVFVGMTSAQNVDRDRDGLADELEGELARTFSPLIIFDSNEGARRTDEPVVLFQMRPLDLRSHSKRIAVKWVFLFARDGGYGRSSDCGNAHLGDNDDAYYELESKVNGLTWTVRKISLSFKGLEWPGNSRLEVDDLRHPIIYMSAGKHHEYFTKDWDQKDSKYSDWGCNDDVNGQGSRVHVRETIRLFGARKTLRIPYNNVGEPESHPSPPFVNDLSPFYSGYSAWANKNFYSQDAGPIKNKWMTHRWQR
jgi:hypothetical protein